jgi:hypothetical protein
MSFEGLEIKIREAEIGDLVSLLKLEDCCWREHLRSSANVIVHRINSFKHGQFVLEVNGEVCGVLYTQRVQCLEALKKCTYQQQHELHDAFGKYWQLLCINIDVKKVANGAYLIRQHAMGVAKSDASVVAVIAMTRCSKFNEYISLTRKVNSIQNYLCYVHENKDPTIFFHRQGTLNLNLRKESFIICTAFKVVRSL